jgi:phage terminase large subunit-like protein
VQNFRQGYASLSGPSKQLENWVVSGKFLHGGHPVLAWQASNVAIQTDSAAGNIKPSKAKSTERIDGIVALVMAIGLWQAATAPAPEQNWDIIAL